MLIVGSFVSPYVRKVLAVLELKGLDYTVDPITPFFGGDEFSRLSPLRRIPVLVDGDFVLNDSSAIVAYLDESAPGQPILPTDPKDRARARWIEEYADSRLGDLIIWGLFYQLFVRRMVWKEEPDQARVDRVVTRELPEALDYLEDQAPEKGFMFGEIGIADISIASFFRNAAYVDYRIDADRWPKLAAWVAATLNHPVLEKLYAWERIQVSTTIENRREALTLAGAPLSESTMATREPRRGSMPL